MSSALGWPPRRPLDPQRTVHGSVAAATASARGGARQVEARARERAEAWLAEGKLGSITELIKQFE